MKKLLILLGFSITVSANAQDYFINFSGEGASPTVSSVKVENLTSGLSLVLSGSDILHLTSLTTGVNLVKNNNQSRLKIYPNPMTDYTRVEIHPLVPGEVLISVRDFTGRTLAENQFYLDNSRHDFTLSGMKTGLYLISVTSKNYQSSGKLFCIGKSNGKIAIEKVNSINEGIYNKEEKKVSKGMEATFDMVYTAGDRLKFTGMSGIYSTVKIDIPESDKTINFKFIGCTDGDANNYPIVQIGDQYWMEENLKTKKYNDGTPIPLVYDWINLETPGYCSYDNNEDANKALYGLLYNWYAVNEDNLCPSGWYVPTDSDWTLLTQYLTKNNYGYTGTTGLGYTGIVTGIAKSLASISGWHSGIFLGTIGKNQSENNNSSFSALPGGSRDFDGTFQNIGKYAGWWSSSEYFVNTSMSRSLYYNGIRIIATDDYKKDGLSVRCIYGTKLLLPVLTTIELSNITETTAQSGGDIINVGDSGVLAQGVCWSKSIFPTVDDNKSIDGSGSRTFVSTITELDPSTTYHLRSYATTHLGTSYGNELTFSTYTSTVSDIEGNVYKTVTVGTKVWMAENLRSTKYNDGTPIPLITDSLIWGTLTSPGYCWYNNDASTYKASYGALYNWFVVNTMFNGNKEICPSGWHVASGDWSDLYRPFKIYYGYDESIGGNELMETGIKHWIKPLGTNETSFSALPGGARLANGKFINLGSNGYYWTQGSLGHLYDGVFYPIPNPDHDPNTPAAMIERGTTGFSVRCVKD